MVDGGLKKFITGTIPELEQSPVEIAKGSKESRRMISLSYGENAATVMFILISLVR